MDLLWLAWIQSLTEFVPVSSSAHLSILSHFLGMAPMTRGLQVGLNVMSLLVVVVYFRHSFYQLTKSALFLFRGKFLEELPYLLKLVVATAPVVMAGFFMHSYGPSLHESLRIMGLSSIFFGALLGIADWKGSLANPEKELSYRDALLIGVAQAFSLVPGASRLGTTLTAARFLGYSREDSARFSFLLSIPVTLGASTLLAKQILLAPPSATLSIFWAVLGSSFVLGYGALHFFMAYTQRHSFLIWALYRIFFGAALLGYTF